MIRCADIINESVVDGPGIRMVVFLQGCPRHCPGCHNEQLIPVEGGRQWAEEDFAELILGRLSPLHRGITFSGGDPLMQAEALATVAAIIKARRPVTDIWLYTGYVYEEIENFPVMKYVDVLVDGPFIKAQKNLDLAFRGSANQRIIDVAQTRAAGEVVECYFDNISKVG